MQQRAGLLFLSKSTGRILLILEESKWTVPTFIKTGPLLDDAKDLMNKYFVGKLLPIELYLSQDKGFEYGTYICLVDNEFLALDAKTYCWSMLDYLPKQLHAGLKNTLSNNIIRAKIETIMELEKNASKN